MAGRVIPFREPEPPPPQDRPRWWTVYDRDGGRLEDVRVSRAGIRETLPDAWVDVAGGRIVVGVPAGEVPGWLVATGEGGGCDVE